MEEPITSPRFDNKTDRTDGSGEWLQYYDETYALHYYVNSVTGECHWGNPVEDVIESQEHYTNVEGEELDSSAVYSNADHSYDEELSADVIHQLDEPVESAESFEPVEPMEAIESSSASPEKNLKKLDYAAVWREYYADSGDEQADQYNPYEHEKDLEEGLEYPPDEYEYDGGCEEQDSDADYNHSVNYEPYNEESAPKTVKNRSKDVLTGGTNQDYLHMARMYKLTRPYSDPSYFGLCVLCHTNFADMVFFPCEHRCLCQECVEKENICSDSQLEQTPHGYCNCSLCASVIKLILPSEGGAEVEQYWNWVYEEPPKLPNNFLRNFRHSAAVINAVHVRTHKNSSNIDSFENASRGCSIS